MALVREREKKVEEIQESLKEIQVSCSRLNSLMHFIIKSI